MTDPDRSAREALDLFGVPSDGGVAVRRLSRGYVQRVALAKSLVHRPSLLVWDEPLTGLDAGLVAKVIDIVAAERARGTAVLLISHDLPELWRLAASVQVIREGELRHSTSTAVDLALFREQYGALWT
jgi:ABC-type multidrug transport system ATPase subunit